MSEKIPVHFNGRNLIWLKDSSGDGPLAPSHHLDDDGHVKFEAAFGSENSYAHVYSDGRIMRYGDVIGSVEDLEFLPSPRSQKD